MNVYSRLRKVVNWLIFNDLVESQNDLAARIGYSSSYMSQVMSSAKVVSESFIGKVCSLDKNLSSTWVLTGEGNMFLNNPFSEFSVVSGSPDQSHSDVVVDASVWAVVKAQAESLAARDRQVDELISMLRSQIEDLKKVDAQTGGRAISADAV